MYDMLKRLMFLLDPESAHAVAEMAIRAIGSCELSRKAAQKIFRISGDGTASLNSENLAQNIFGVHFANPIGIAGGFDKNATMIKGLSDLGFGYIEVGTFTWRPQSGNKKPRLFRLISENSIQNAMGFNNDGAAKIAQRLAKIYPFSTPILANIGKNRTTPNSVAIKDYLYLARRFDELCDAFVINISSPNTPNLRDLQNESFINELFSALKSVSQKPLILKISPDMSLESAIKLCGAAIESGAAGVIANNTSVDYALSPNAKSFGGLSGELITAKSRELFKELGAAFYGKTILISSGGISTAAEAYERIKMGASLVQIYTAFIFKGPMICADINTQMLNMLANDGFSSIADAVGTGIKR